MNPPLTAPALYVCADQMAAEKEMLENELQEARVVHNLLRYTANKLTSKSYSATTMPAAMAMAQSEPVTKPLAASRRSSKVIPETTNPFGFEDIKPEVLSGTIPPLNSVFLLRSGHQVEAPK